MNDKDPTVNHKVQTAMLSRLDDLDLPEPPWAYGDFTASGDRPADLATGLVSLAFIKAALWRGARVWCLTAIAGLLIGLGVYVAYPPAHQASATVLLTLGPYENANSATLDNQAVAQSRAVAGLATSMLGLRQDAGVLLAEYTVTIVSPDVLKFTASAPSAGVAVSRADTVAAAFLQFRARQLEAEQNLALGSASQQVSKAQQKLNAISQQISQLPAQPTSPAQQAALSKLRAERNQAATTLSALQSNAGGNSVGAATSLAVKNSKVLDAANPIFQSRLKRVLPRPAIGFLLGLALGMGIVVIGALSSDKLRRRDDIAQALGAPVQLSVGNVRLSRWLPRRRGLAAARGADVSRIVAHLRSALPTVSRGAATLAVVPVDDPRVAALSVVSLALSCAEQGNRVVVADLVGGAPAARLLRAGQPGVGMVRVRGVDLVVAVPERADMAPTGPFGRTGSRAPRSSFGDAVAADCASADLLLTLAALDPSIGGDHLPTWADGAVAMVTAGQSSWTQVHAVGQMLRLAGMPPASAVVVGADKYDESLGRTDSPRSAASVGPGLGGISR